LDVPPFVPRPPHLLSLGGPAGGDEDAEGSEDEDEDEDEDDFSDDDMGDEGWEDEDGEGGGAFWA
jgi:hypothetical protein